MQRLILLRHGAAQSRALSGRDVDRVLAPAGRAAAGGAAEALQAAGATPEVVRFSPALRTRQTWEAAASVWPGLAAREAPELYNAAAETILEVARGADADVVLIVGHNPGLADLATGLTEDTRPRAGFPPASAAVFDRVGEAWTLAFWRAGEGAMTRLYKIVPRAEWEGAEAAGVFLGSAVDLADGFIHFSTAAQVAETAARHFRGQVDLVVLEVDGAGLGSALRWEPSRGGAMFPHLYAPLATRDVQGVAPAPLDPDGVPITASHA